MVKRQPTFMIGFRPVIHAREGRMFGIRNPLDGPVFDRLQDAIASSMGVMADHFDRGLGLADAKTERFKGMVGKRASYAVEMASRNRAVAIVSEKHGVDHLL